MFVGLKSILKSTTSLAAIAWMLALNPASATAAEYRMGQSNKKFAPERLSIQIGDSVLFVNDDEISHNVASSSAGNEFDLGAQASGTAIPVTFTKPGEVQVRCLIHPHMKATIEVLP